MKNKKFQLLWQGKNIPRIHIDGNSIIAPSEANIENSNDFKEKSLAFYSHLVGQWFENRMEETRFIINISAGAIGLLVTLLTFIDKVPMKAWLLVLYIVAIIGFLVSLIFSGICFRLNTIYLEKLKSHLEGNDTTEPKSISWIDWIAWITFFVALFSIVLFFIFYLLIINKMTQ